MVAFHELRAKHPGLADITPWTVEWYEKWRELHLSMYPNADQCTRDNLDMFVDRARAAQAQVPSATAGDHGNPQLDIVGVMG